MNLGIHVLPHFRGRPMIWEGGPRIFFSRFENLHVAKRQCIKHIFYIKHNAYIDTLAMGYLATGEIFQNMLQLKRFGLYFEGIMNRKGLLS